jgi:hypothetical protein
VVHKFFVDFEELFCYFSRQQNRYRKKWATVIGLEHGKADEGIVKKITTEKQEEEMKRIIMLGMAIVMMFISIYGCMKATGDTSKGERSDIQANGERGGNRGQSTGSGGFGVK